MIPATELVETYLRHGCDGNAVDTAVCALSPNLTDTATKIQVPLTSLADLVTMAKPLQKAYFGAQGGNSFVVFALYPHSDPCPVSRVYYVEAAADTFMIVKSSLSAHQIQLVPLADKAELERLADCQGAPQRIRAWKDKHDTPQHKAVERLAKGRHKNTFVGETIYLRSSRCLLCKELGVRLMMSTIGSEMNGKTLMFPMCEEHCNEAQKDSKSVLDYLASKFGARLHLSWSDFRVIDPETDDEYFDDAIRLMTDVFGCSLVKEPNHKTREITGLRPSGFKVIVRIQSQVKHGYAYMVLRPDGVHVQRIDDAKDHPDLDIRWDHRHIGLPKENKSTEPSFTFGYAIADAKAILALIEEAERNLAMLKTNDGRD